jgi:hypothetical protein
MFVVAGDLITPACSGPGWDDALTAVLAANGRRHRRDHMGIDGMDRRRVHRERVGPTAAAP